MSDQLSKYRCLELAWMLARVEAGGELTMAEEVMWTDAVGDVWRTLSEEERELVEDEPGQAFDGELVDCDVRKGDSHPERTAA